MTWKELVDKKEFLSDCDPKLLRLPEDHQFYSLFRKYVPREAALNIIREQMDNNDVSLVANNFPYTAMIHNLPVKHYCLWSIKGRLENNEICDLVKKYFPNNEWFYSERKTNHKSVPEIWHCHIFVKFEKQDLTPTSLSSI
jgi:hypothetical protein